MAIVGRLGSADGSRDTTKGGKTMRMYPHGGHGLGRWFGHFGRGWGRRYRRGRWDGLFGGGMPDQQVQSAQSCLAQVVDPSVPQDGLMGPRTRQAIRTFQMQQQMPPTGMLDSDTMSALQAACSPQQAAPPPPPPPPPTPPPPQVQVSAPPPGSKRSQGQGQQEAFLGDFLNPLGPLGGVIGGLFQSGGSQPQPPPPPDDGHDPWHWRRRRFGRWHHETENEFPFESPFFDFHRRDGFPEERWRWNHRRHDWWDQGRESEVRAGGPEGQRGAGGSAVSGQRAPRPVAPGGGVARPVVDRPVVERPVIEHPVIERPMVERSFIERPVFARPSFSRLGDFQAHERFPIARDRWNWNRDRFRWFGRPWGRRDWGFRFRGEQIAWAQSCLTQVLGPWVVQDGVFGPATQGALRTFQEQQQLPPTGLLDENTVNALQAACGSQIP